MCKNLCIIILHRRGHKEIRFNRVDISCSVPVSGMPLGMSLKWQINELGIDYKVFKILKRYL